MHLPRDCECVYADRHSAPRGHYAVAPPTSIRRHVRDRLDHLAQPLAPSAGGDLALAAAQAAAPLAPRERGPQLPWLLGLTAPPQQAAQVPLPLPSPISDAVAPPGPAQAALPPSGESADARKRRRI